MTLADDLAVLVTRPWLLVGIGSDLRGDDAFGPLLARRLAKERLPALDAGTAPESLTGPILRSGAEVLILADVGNLGAVGGTLRLLAPEAVAPGGTSTHDPSLRLLIAYLQAQRPFTVRVLAVEPVCRGLGTPPSREVLAAVGRAADAFIAAMRSAAGHESDASGSGGGLRNRERRRAAGNAREGSSSVTPAEVQAPLRSRTSSANRARFGTASFV